MSGEMDLSRLLQGMTPVLQDGVYGFTTVAPASDMDGDTVAKARMVFREDEGVTLVLPWDVAIAGGLVPQFRSRMISLTVHSALEAVGFMAAVSAALTRAGISTNPVAGFYHDHLFVPEDRAGDAMAVLEALASGAQTRP